MGRLASVSGHSLVWDGAEFVNASSTMVTATAPDTSNGEQGHDEDPLRSSPKVSASRKGRKGGDSIIGSNKKNAVVSSLPTSVTSTKAASSSEAYQIRAKLLYRLGIYDTKLRHSGESDSNDPAGAEGNGGSQTSSSPDDYKSPAERRRTRLMNLGGSPAAAVASAHTFTSRVGKAPALVIQGDGRSSSPRPWLVPAEGTVTLRVPLKFKSDGTKPQSKSRVSFDEAVSVVPIPRRSDYSRRVSSRMWTRGEEIRNNAARNVLEFAAEGWDWRTVMEDHQMYVDAVTGELIHPVHLTRTVTTSAPPHEPTPTPTAEEVDAAGFTPLTRRSDSLMDRNESSSVITTDSSDPSDLVTTECAR